jgi:hypothetical protein
MVTGTETSSDNRLTWSTVTKYDGGDGNIMVTGPGVIPATMTVDGESVNGRGTGYFDNFIYVTIDPTSTPAAGDSFGPVEDEWFIGPSGSGFSAQGPLASGSDPLMTLFYRGGGGKGGEGAQGRLLSGITPCDNALTGATTFTFAKYVEADIDPQTDPLTLMEEVDDSSVAVVTTGVNRSPLEADIDGHVVCVKINDEWVPVLVFDVCPT